MSTSVATDLPARGRSRGRRWLQNLALAGAVFLGCGLVCELVLRLAGYGHLEIYEPDARLFWRLKPNQDCYTKVNRQPVHINSLGTRDREFSPAKPAATLRVLSLGDSRTFGWGLADEETYSRRLERQLQAAEDRKPPSAIPAGERSAPGRRRFEVINAGVNAWSYAQMAVYLREFGLRYEPDVVVLGEANLWTQFSEHSDPTFVRKFLGRVRLKNFLRRFALYHFIVEVQLQEFYQRHRTRFIPVDPQQDALFKEQQQGDPDAVFRAAMADVCRTARSNHILPVLLFLPTLDDLQSTNRSRVWRAKQVVSAELGVPLVDLTPDLAPAGKALYLDADPVHLNARGNEVVAQRIFESITNHLAP